MESTVCKGDIFRVDSCEVDHFGFVKFKAIICEVDGFSGNFYKVDGYDVNGL